MNLKERGITIGDLLIILIIIITTTLFFKTFKDDKKTSFKQSNQVKISHNKILLSNKPSINLLI